MARTHIARSALALVAVLGAGCAPEFDKVSEIETLRVLAVQKTRPYAVPGETVTLSMLWRDGFKNPDGTPPAAPRPVQILWLTGCENPPGDLFFSCFAPKPLFMDGGGEQCGAPPLMACNSKVEVQISPTIADRPPPSDPTQPAYGLSYVFFAICAGEIKPISVANEFDFPFGCFDEANNRLGPADFVAGYTSMYVYKPELAITNANPDVSGLVFRGAPVENRCLGDECLNIPASWRNLRCIGTAEPDPPDGSLAVPCVAPCEDDGDESCPSTEFRPELVLPEGGLARYPEPDVLSNLTRDRDITEQMWINYYTEGGGVKSEVRLLNDAFAGVNDDFGTEFWAPKETGATVLWAVVHDNRGGMSWVGAPILIEKPPATP